MDLVLEKWALAELCRVSRCYLPQQKFIFRIDLYGDEIQKNKNFFDNCIVAALLQALKGIVFRPNQKKSRKKGERKHREKQGMGKIGGENKVLNSILIPGSGTG